MKNEELFQDSMLAFINSDIIASESGGGFLGGRANILLITALPNSSCIWNNSILGTYRGRKRENSFFQATHLSPSLPIGPPTLEQTNSNVAIIIIIIINF